MADRQYGLDTFDPIDSISEAIEKIRIRDQAVKDDAGSTDSSISREWSSAVDTFTGNIKLGIGTLLPEGETAQSWRLSAEEDFAAANVQKSKSRLTQSWEEVEDSESWAEATNKALEWGLVTGIQSVPTSAGVIAGAVAGGIAAPALGVTAATAALAGGTLAGFSPKFGGYIKDQQDLIEQETGQLVSEQEAGELARTAAAAAASSFADIALGVEGMAFRAFGREVAGNALYGGIGRAGSVLTSGARVGIEEAATELFDQVMSESLKSGISTKGYSMTGEEALKNYKEALIGGAVLGAVTGGIGGAVVPDSVRLERHLQEQRRLQDEAYVEQQRKIAEEAEAVRKGETARVRLNEAKAAQRAVANTQAEARLKTLGAEARADAQMRHKAINRFHVKTKDKLDDYEGGTEFEPPAAGTPEVQAFIRNEAIDATKSLSEPSRQLLADGDVDAFASATATRAKNFSVKNDTVVLTSPSVVEQAVREATNTPKRQLTGWDADFVRSASTLLSDPKIPTAEKFKTARDLVAAERRKLGDLHPQQVPRRAMAIKAVDQLVVAGASYGKFVGSAKALYDAASAVRAAPKLAKGADFGLVAEAVAKEAKHQNMREWKPVRNELNARRRAIIDDVMNDPDRSPDSEAYIRSELEKLNDGEPKMNTREQAYHKSLLRRQREIEKAQQEAADALRKAEESALEGALSLLEGQEAMAEESQQRIADEQADAQAREDNKLTPAKKAEAAEKRIKEATKDTPTPEGKAKDRNRDNNRARTKQEMENRTLRELVNMDEDVLRVRDAVRENQQARDVAETIRQNVVERLQASLEAADDKASQDVINDVIRQFADDTFMPPPLSMEAAQQRAAEAAAFDIAAENVTGATLRKQMAEQQAAMQDMFDKRIRTLQDQLAELRSAMDQRVREATTPEQVDEARREFDQQAAETRNQFPKIDRDRAAPEGEATTLPEDQVASAVARMTSGWTNLPKIEVVNSKQNYRDTNPALQDKIDEARAEVGTLPDGRIAAKGRITNINGQDTILIYSDRVASEADLAASVWHEALGHFGLRSVYGQELNNLLGQIVRTTPWFRARAIEKAKQLGYSPTNKKAFTVDELIVPAEEVLVEMGEANRNGTVNNANRPQTQGFISRITNMIRRLARRMGLNNLQFSENEIWGIISDARRAVTGGPSKDNIIGNLNRDRLGDSLFSRREPRTAAGDFRPDENARPESVDEYMASVRETLKQTVTEKVYGAMPTRDFVELAKSRLPSIANYLDAMAEKQKVENEISQSLEDVLQKAGRLSPVARTRAQDFLKLSTTLQKWGFQPDWLSSPVTTDPRLVSQWETMSADEKEVITDAFRHGYDTNQRMKRTLSDEFKRLKYGRPDGSTMEVHEFDALPPAEKAARQRAFSSWSQFAADLSMGNDTAPYVPLMRFGDWVVTARSQELLDLKEQAKTAKQPQLEALRQKIASMEQMPEHNMVMFAESAGKAKTLEENIKADPQFQHLKTQRFRKAEMHNQEGGAPWQLMRDLRDAFRAEVKNGMPEEVASYIDQTISGLYVQTLAENTARRQRLPRQTIAGATDDIFRAMAHKGSSDARFISSVSNGARISSALAGMRREADAASGEERLERRNILWEVMKRHAQLMKPIDNWDDIQNRIMAASSVWHLMTVPRYYIQNALQTWMMTAPYMAGRFGNRAYGEIYNAYKPLWEYYGKLLKTKDKTNRAAWGDFDIDSLPDTLVTPAEKAMLHEAKRQGLLDIGLAFELGKWQAAHSGNPMSRMMNNVMDTLSAATREVEALNRVSSALAAYRLSNGGTEYAMEVLRNTQFDYSKLNAPRYFNMLPKVMTQFRKYQVFQLALGAGLVHKWLKGDPNAKTQEERELSQKVAGRTLLYLIGQTGAMTGALGLPVVNIGMYLVGNIFGGDEEGTNPEVWMREAIGNERLANMILKGAPAAVGVDVSATIGWGQSTALLPFTDVKLSDENSLYEAAYTLGFGPAGAMGVAASRAYGYYLQGDTWKGTEALMPSGLRAVSKTAREQFVQGYTKRNGDVLMSPEEYDFADSALGVLGFTSSRQAKAYLARSIEYQYKEAFQNTSTKLKRQFIEAQDNNDRQEMSAIRDRWLRLQEAKQRVLGMKRSPLSDLYSARKDQRDRERRAQDQFNAARRLIE